MAEHLPALYSFRRCPYAIRARLALAAAGLRPGTDLELREVALKARLPELLADWALLPFVRHCHQVDPTGFAAESGLAPLQAWLDRFLVGAPLRAVMADSWAPRLPWRSPSWLYHLALRDDWQRARAAGDYRCSTRGRSLEEVGFIHLSQAHQVAATAARFYGDVPAGQLLLLTLERTGLAVRLEPAPPSGELFPHLYGPLPLPAVLFAEPFAAAGGVP